MALGMDDAAVRRRIRAGAHDQPFTATDVNPSTTSR